MSNNSLSPTHDITRAQTRLEHGQKRTVPTQASGNPESLVKCAATL
ncbi:predicted protein [Plenodomus lingam JN3]|uniref:Predicted protein n=1 Tax=Leptosphaeria maculans (strain JN3 / isolate v23.1.3 / race Av1-4-5-6-7-8) TaxID=985895 RepID=E5A3H2_LEPMJ|nr:predicted protein [Plenodomus lingam JN3]CBX98185.1 predicted protein [Plenodomus lingam JN3]